jgi:cytochrome P450
MLNYWFSAGNEGVNTLEYDTRTLTLDVLVHVAFGKSFDFRGSHEKTKSNGPLTYRDALAIVLHDALLMLALGQGLARRLAFIPRLGRLSEAADQFKKYMTDMFNESSQAEHGQKARGNLISSLVRASTDEKLITPEEVIGNIFVFSFAGHDTTAHSFAFTFMLLAGHLEVQDWITEEIRYVVNGERDLKNRYELFPRLVRTLAVLVSLPIPRCHCIADVICSSRLCVCTIHCSVSSRELKLGLPGSPSGSRTSLFLRIHV